MKSHLGSLILVITIFTGSVNADNAVVRMGFGWCYCIINGSEVTTMNDKVIVTDGNIGRMFLFTLDGYFTGHLGHADECDEDPTFKPKNVYFADNYIYAICAKDNALKRFDKFGELQDTFKASDLGFRDTTLKAFSSSVDYIYLAFDNILCAFEKDMTIYKQIIIQKDMLAFHDGKLFAISKNSILSVYDAELNLLEEHKNINGSYLGQITSPTDFVIDEDGNLWVADSGNNRVQVFWKEGGFSTWGETALSWSYVAPREDPILATQSIFEPKSIDLSNKCFYVSDACTNISLAVSKSALTKTFTDSSVHITVLKLKKSTYDEQIKNIWMTNQNLYPKAFILVFISEQESILVDGQEIAKGDEVHDFLSNQTEFEKLVTLCFCPPEEPTQINFDTNGATIHLLAKAPPKYGLDWALITTVVSGSTTPLLANEPKVFLPDGFGQVEAKVSLPEDPSILLCLLIDKDGRPFGMRVLR